MRNLFTFGLLSLLAFGCNAGEKQVNDTQEDITSPNDLDNADNQNDTQDPESLFNPDFVFFYSSIVVGNEDNIDCFDDGDSTPYCGVFRYMLVDYENWEGTDDMSNACHIIHKLDPVFVTATDQVVETDYNGWTIDASQSHVGNSAMCDFINEETDEGALVNKLSTTSFQLGIGPTDSDMEESFRDFVVESQDQNTWDTGFKPYILAQSVSVDGFTVQPNFMYAVERDGDGQPIVVDDQYQLLEVAEMDSLVNAWYRTRTWYGYEIDKLISE